MPQTEVPSPPTQPPTSARTPKVLTTKLVVVVFIGVTSIAAQFLLSRTSPSRSFLKPSVATTTSEPLYKPPSPATSPYQAEGSSLCVDTAKDCSAWAERGECENNGAFMKSACRLSCGACEPVALRSDAPPPLPKAIAKDNSECQDESEFCLAWASSGECDKNPQYMKAHCAASCGTCMSSQAACRRDESTRAELPVPGGINAMFERAVRDFPQYTPEIISRDPWLIAFNDFITEDEGAAFFEHCNKSLTRSLAGDQVSPVRTSHQCWCSSARCLADKRIQAIEKRVSNITMVPVSNFEYGQVLRYEPGQFYKVHHDQNCAPWTPQGLRLFTCAWLVGPPARARTLRPLTRTTPGIYPPPPPSTPVSFPRMQSTSTSTTWRRAAARASRIST